MEEKDFKTLKFFLGIFFIIFLALTSVWFGVSALNKFKESKFVGKKEKNTITVSGIGEIWVKPDLAIIDFSINTEGKTVQEAFGENSKKMNSVIEAIKNQGVNEKDLKTTRFNIYPRYEWIDKNIIFPEGKRILVGYVVEQTLQVKIRDFEKIGEIINLAVERGINEMGDLQFIVEKEDELKSQARKEAIEKAKKEAQEIAQQLGVKLGKIVTFQENQFFPGFPVYFSEKTIKSNQTTGPQVQSGENKIQIKVSLVYEIE